ncbi:mechanosensitive ion channel family protein [Candidatus Gracilibacteria bacterium]|nr:mechanosensitive ion channel family protein [Candidatus Gracilibacteria bacterium]
MVEAYEVFNRSIPWQRLLGVLSSILLSGVLIDFALRPLLRAFAQRLKLTTTAYVMERLRGRLLPLFVIEALRQTIIDMLPIWIAPFGRWFFTLLLVAYGAWVLSGIVTELIQRALGGTEGQSVSILTNVARGAGLLIISMIGLSFFNVPLGPLLTVIGSSSFGLAFALRGPLSNLFAGMQIIASNRLRVGQYIRLGSGEEGFVTDILWSDTTIQQLANNMVVVPNAVITTTTLYNFDHPGSGLWVVVEALVHFDADLDMVQRITLEEAAVVQQKVVGGISTGSSLFRYLGFEEYGIRMQVILRGDTFVDQFLLKHEFIARLQARFQHEGIAIPVPVRALYSEGLALQQESGVRSQESGV